MEAKDRIICALDVDNAYRALQLIRLLREHVGVFKVGLELVTAAGVQIFEKLRDAGAERLFYDAKLHDIPNTVAGAMRGVVRLGVWAVTVHATGGTAMLRAAVDAASRSAEMPSEPAPQARPKVLAVTALTSLSADTLRDELRVALPMREYVTHLARLAHAAGCDGVIASPHEIEAVRAAVPSRDFLIVTPGVRPPDAGQDDQARTLTPAEALQRGADYLVVGRPIVAAPDPAEAAQQLAATLS